MSLKFIPQDEDIKSITKYWLRKNLTWNSVDTYMIEEASELLLTPYTKGLVRQKRFLNYGMIASLKNASILIILSSSSSEAWNVTPSLTLLLLCWKKTEAQSLPTCIYHALPFKKIVLFNKVSRIKVDTS